MELFPWIHLLCIVTMMTTKEQVHFIMNFVSKSRSQIVTKKGFINLNLICRENSGESG
jgi:hypothetical protein